MQSKRCNSFLIIIVGALLVALGWPNLPVISPRSLNAAAPAKISAFPAEGSRHGGEAVQIQGGPFTASVLTVIQPVGQGGSITMNIPVVKFGDRSNLKKPDDDALLTNSAARVTLPGGISATYTPGNGNLILSTVEAGFKYQATYNYAIGSPVFINTRDLVCDSTFYPHEELIKISDDTKYLLVEAGYARWASLKPGNASIIELKTPSYYTVGDVELLVQNANKDEFKTKFKYFNSASNPQISSILREGQNVLPETIDNILLRPIRVNYKGGNTITMVGTDFRANLKIKIGDITSLDASKIDAQVPGQISFTVPKADKKEVGKLIPLQLLNEDGGLALSTELNPPVYLQYTQGDTSPAISKISPAKGWACGGQQVTIEGKDFCRPGEVYGFTGQSLVSFGGIKVPDNNVRIIDYKTIQLTVPGNTAGPKNVVVENPDGELAVLANAYTYVSMPIITEVKTTAAVSGSVSKVSVNGGQELTIKGSGFMKGAKVIFAPAEPQALTAPDSSTNFIYLVRDTSRNLADCRFSYPTGTEGIDPVYIDNNTIKVKVPAGQLDSSGIMIINPDAGASEIFKNFTYTLEELPAVKGVIAELLYNRVIKIHWDAVPLVKYYEVYVQADNGDLEILGTTKTNSMIFENYNNHTRYRFLVRAVADSAISLPSQYSNEVYGYQSGGNDMDGSLEASSRITRSGSQLLINLGKADNYANLMPVILNRSEYLGVKETIITIPTELLNSYSTENIIVIGSDFRLSFNPRVFNAVLSGSEGVKADAGIRFTMKAGPAVASKKVTVLSNVYQLTASYYSGSKQTAVDYLAGNINLELNYNPGRSLTPKANTRLGRGDDKGNQWFNTNGVVNPSSQRGLFTINRMGRYAVIGERK